MSIAAIAWCVIIYLYLGYFTLAGSDGLQYDLGGMRRLLVFIFWPIACVVHIYKMIANVFRKRKENKHERS